MKVLFAVSNDNITTSVVSKYQQTYKEIITSKNVYYFNAIIKELQNDKTYDAIVIGEDLEPISNNNYEAIDKFLIEKLDRISDEASKPTGEDIPIIFICTERRSKSSQLLRRLFSMSIYNALIGNDRSVNMVCALINKPRNKKEAKRYYQIETDQAEYETESEELVSEEQIQNILNYYKKIGSNETKCVEAFDSIAKQYDNTQLRIIVKFLPMSVKAILETNSATYQQLMTGGTVLSNGKYNKYKPEPAKNKNTLEFLEKDLEKTKLSEPVVIPSTMNISNSQVSTNSNNYNNQSNFSSQANTTNNQIYGNIGQKSNNNMNNNNNNNNNNLYNNNYNLYNQQNKSVNNMPNTQYGQSTTQNNMQSNMQNNYNAQVNPQNNTQYNSQVNQQNNNQYNVQANQQNVNQFDTQVNSQSSTQFDSKINEQNNNEYTTLITSQNETQDNKLQTIGENSLMSVQPMPVEPVKRGRGRPRKNPIETDAIPKVKRGRGRPRKNSIEELSPLPTVDDLNQLPGTESANDTLNRLLGTDSTNNVDTELETTNALSSTETLNTLPGIDVMSEVKADDTQDILPGLESIDTLPGLESINTQDVFSENTEKQDNISENAGTQDILKDLETIDTTKIIEENTNNDDILSSLSEIDNNIQNSLPKTDENFVNESEENNMNNFNQTPYENNQQNNNQNPFGMNNFNSTPYGNDMNNPNQTPYGNGMNNYNQTPYGNGINNNNQTPYRNGMNNFNQTPYGNGMSNNNQTPYGNGMNNNNQTPYGNGMDNFNQTPYGNGMNNYNQNPYGNDMNGINQNPYGNGMNNYNQTPYGNQTNNMQNPYGNQANNDNQNMFNEQNNNLIGKNDVVNNEPNGLIAKNGKVALFVGTTKNGTSFIINNLASLLSNSGINTAILDLTKNRNAYYMFTDNKSDLMKVAQNSLQNLQNGLTEGVKVNKNLTVYTGLPEDNLEQLDPKSIIANATSNYEIVLLDCDFGTDSSYYTLANEIYLVQSMDAFTIQPLTKLLSDLKNNNLLDESKLRVIINKYVKTNKIDAKMVIGGMSKYNEPSMTLQRDIFNPDNIQSIVVPFEAQNYIKYIEDIAMCHLSLNGYSKTLIQSLEQLKNMVYPLIAGNNNNNNNNNNNFNNNQPKKRRGFFGSGFGSGFGSKKEEDTTFSNDMNSTLDKMRTNY